MHSVLDMGNWTIRKPNSPSSYCRMQGKVSAPDRRGARGLSFANFPFFLALL
jgi:hypothetical protein